MSELDYRKILIRQQYFANLIKILICQISNLSDYSGPALQLAGIVDEIDTEISYLRKKEKSIQPSGDKADEFKSGEDRRWFRCPYCRKNLFTVRSDTKIQHMPFRCKACKHDIEVNI